MTHSITPQERAWLLCEKYANNPSPLFEQDLERLTCGEPLAYVIGTMPFLGALIDLSYKPLIPRVETEHWVEQATASLRERNKEPRMILDLFSGSGCIGIAFAQAFSGARVHFAEYDQTLIPQIAKNVALNITDASRTNIFQSDVFSAVQGHYDVITANPPYIPESRKEALDASVTHFEPHKALFAGSDGLACIRPLIADAPKFLNSDGSLFIEFDSEQKDEIERIVNESEHWKSAHFMRDQYDAWRAVELVRS